MTLGGRFLTLLLLLLLGSLRSVANATNEAADSCEGLLKSDSFEVLIANKVFISQFSPGIDRSQSDALCAPVAAANAAQALYFSLTGQAVYPNILINYVNEVWGALKDFSEVKANQGLPFSFLPALALGAAYQLKMDDRVVPFGSSDPEWLAANPQEVVSTRSRIRVLGVKTKTGAHSLLSLGIDFGSKELIVLDPNDASKSLRMKLEQRDGRLYLRSPDDGKNVKSLFGSLGADGTSYEVLSVFGLNLKEVARSANDPTFSESN